MSNKMVGFEKLKVSAWDIFIRIQCKKRTISEWILCQTGEVVFHHIICQKRVEITLCRIVFVIKSEVFGNVDYK